ncbi:chromosome partition protein Smc [Acinetobacter sp. KAM398]|uniref:chromosome segregation protein SMC n=1 Tax=unclassified Acinetobacter TaxID=196816 RepID=UPI001F238FF6|nr:MULTISPECIES: chromosome segregation protein SMC [unclassified Acinetobacter]GJC31270.1 chromosome partition protein Smc [Acinetobacter sp. KAM392]GJC34110.1 chromosome partition protein Smc [Acinetobacter sp. KAM393]GJC36938.1 chromosome partition protein Smc [Acinetobacter sp. KAM394]GJC39727.1 chromosome partition protein Smc [Acinetobacter sp. KAM395]GJC42740.1 chromosome partition protein Smc [Acinetobacter sp. KAM396]
MRLSSLKLSGFKSFADSTTLHFKANRTAVVGPNGCGKSNVIDAIRWVMGESSARQLRGGSMQDVIFTGTAKRKPVGVASVELRFDNTYGKLGGAYNAYNELSVRRQVNRDGKSEYFLNGTKCRRRDITDIFLGTGLGPRSYAIIEQGMINRLVDAKPEEMRVFIEEAAGVSRYQARRRETMLHLDHTTQNLARLEDIASELKSQLKTLKRQSETAIQYKALESEIRTIKVEVLSFQCEQSARLQQEYTLSMNELGESFKLVRSELSTLEHDLTATSELFQRLIHLSTPLQQEWQQAEKKLAELKMTLEQKQSLFQQNTATLSQLEQQKAQTKERLQLIELQLESLVDQQENQQGNLQQQEHLTQQQSQQFQDLKAQQQTQAAQYAQVKAQVEQQQQKHVHMQAQSEQLAKNISRIEQQKQTLTQQFAQIQPQDQQEGMQQLQDEKTRLQAEMLTLELNIQDSTQQLATLQASYNEHKAQCATLKSEIQILQSEQKNLNQLLIKQSPKKQADVVQLMQVLQLTEVAKPHANLIEKFLAKWLSAQVVEADTEFQDSRARQLKVQVTLDSQTSKIQLSGCESLSDWIVSPQSSLWQSVAITESLSQALALQTQLQAGQSILSLDGYHVGPDWVIGLFYDEAAQAGQGALSHRIRLEQIEQALAQHLPQYEQAEQQLPELQQQVQQLQQQLQQQQHQLKQQQQALQTLDVQMAKAESAAQAFAVQKQQLQHQLAQLDEQLEEDAMQKDDLEIDLHALAFKLEQALPQYKTLQFQVEQLNEQLDSSQQQFQQQQQEVELLRRQAVQTQQQIELLEKDATFLKAQYQQIMAQMEQAKKFVDPVQLELPALETQFSEQQQETEKLQKTWQEWQVELHSVQSKQQQLTEQRQQQQQQDEQLRAKLEEKRLAWQSAKSDYQHYSEQLKDLNSEIITGLQIDVASHQQKLLKAQQQFDKLGAVNLAASEEYEEVTARFAELSYQIEDLQNTVSQLQAAMKSIDQETRKLFMNTFDQINTELQELFPKVFNGGEASLSLEDDWQSGVKLMARPPGKRNSSLALLSGGEKALTALALVFAIFRLNPAPFCVLDEVDAPLDDANVGRFCNLVKELSEQVQFIYITHNKLAMTMATDLLGVTMPEPGTSKLVTVNIEEAAEYGLVAEA